MCSKPFGVKATLIIFVFLLHYILLYCIVFYCFALSFNVYYCFVLYSPLICYVLCNGDLSFHHHHLSVELPIVDADVEVGSSTGHGQRGGAQVC